MEIIDAMEDIVNGINIDSESLKKLEAIFCAIQMQNPLMQKNIPNLLLIAEDGAGVTTLAKGICKYMMQNHVFRTYGKQTYLELKLPVPGNDRTLLDKFFASARIVAVTQNRFYGVFLVDLSDWEGKDLLVHNVNIWDRLMNFVEVNRENIYFCFRINPDFKETQLLENELRKHLPLRNIILNSPEISHGEEFIYKKLMSDGLILSPDAKNELHRLLAQSDFHEKGYRSLELLVQELEYHLLMKLENDELIKEITGEMIQRLEAIFVTQKEPPVTKIGYGFC